MEGSDMEIKSFRIKNYRSIKDSGPCYLSGDNITILAGKNESGKTAILEALEDFNRDKPIRDDALPLHNREAKPEIAITFEIDTETHNAIFQDIGIEKRVLKPISVQYKKKYPSDYSYLFSVEGKRISIKDERLIKSKRKAVQNLYTQLTNVHSEFPQLGVPLPEINLDDVGTFEAQLSDFRRNVEPNLTQISDEQKRDSFTQALEETINISTEIGNLESADKNFLDQLRRWIPNFILFSSFEDVFPSEIPLDEAPDNKLIQDLVIISDLDLDTITSSSAPLKAKHKKQLNIRVAEEYRKFWEQDPTNLYIDWDSTNLYFFITEGDNYYPPNMRSKGKQWHLAFYIRVSARAREDVLNIILIDEPAGYLHAKAQKDVIRKLEDAANDAPIIFSTHSPYLIDINKLNRIRLVSRTTEEEGTLISNKIHKSADKETLTPIITAIGCRFSG